MFNFNKFLFSFIALTILTLFFIIYTTDFTSILLSELRECPCAQCSNKGSNLSSCCVITDIFNTCSNNSLNLASCSIGTDTLNNEIYICEICGDCVIGEHTCINYTWIYSIIFIFNNTSVYNDVAEPWDLSFQDGASKIMEGINLLHNNIFYYLIVIFILISYIFIIIFFRFFNTNLSYKFNHGKLIELIWTITPALVLIAIAFPSFKLLYLMDEVINPEITLKVSGKQWYWGLEYSDYISVDSSTLSFESYMIPTDDIELGQLRLLEVDNRIILPINTHIRFIVTSTDVIHSFAIPSLGIKMDAIPGRLNQTSTLINRPGVFYGQCMELCGIHHAFMPIVIEAVSLNNYITWLSTQN